MPFSSRFRRLAGLASQASRGVRFIPNPAVALPGFRADLSLALDLFRAGVPSDVAPRGTPVLHALDWSLARMRWLEGVREPVRTADRVRNELQRELDSLRCRLDVPDALVDESRLRRSDEYLAVFSKPNPLVTVCIGTYNRARLVSERSVPSVLRQDYDNLEVLVVGDCCTDDTGERLAKLNDSRIRFVNLEQRGQYPDDPELRWMVAGTVPFNHALSIARGDFVTHLDDDDEYLPERISLLLDQIRRERADLVYHPFYRELEDGWRLNPALAFAKGQVTTSSVLYHRWFARIGWDLDAYRMREAGDWNRFRKLQYLGARTVRCPKPLLRHFREKANSV